MPLSDSLTVRNRPSRRKYLVRKGTQGWSSLPALCNIDVGDCRRLHRALHPKDLTQLDLSDL